MASYYQNKVLVFLMTFIVLITTLIAIKALQSPQLPVVGYVATPLLAPFFIALDMAKEKADGRVAPKRFSSSSDVGIALLSGSIPAGFVDKTTFAFIERGGEGQFEFKGAITFPYGAALVMRKDFHLRLPELVGKKIAVSGPSCVLWKQFRRDAKRLGLNVDSLQTTVLTFDTMLPALEARVVDAILVKGSYAALAELQGHSLLYQNWDVAAGDECCPAIIAQIEWLFVVKKGDRRFDQLIADLKLAETVSPELVRKSVARNLGYPDSALSQLPLSSYTDVTQAMLDAIRGHRHSAGEDHHGHENK